MEEAKLAVAEGDAKMKRLLALAFIALIIMFAMGWLQRGQIEDLRVELTNSHQNLSELRLDRFTLQRLTSTQKTDIIRLEVLVDSLEAQLDEYKTLYEQRYQPDPQEIKQLIWFNGYAIRCHLYYVYNPSQQNVYTGDTNFHKWVVGLYERTGNVLEELLR